MKSKLKQLLKKQTDNYKKYDIVTDKLVTLTYLNMNKSFKQTQFKNNIKFIIYFIITSKQNQIYCKYSNDNTKLYQHTRIVQQFNIEHDNYNSFVYINYNSKYNKQYDLYMYNSYGQLQLCQLLNEQIYWKNFDILYDMHCYFNQNFSEQSDIIYFKYERNNKI